MNLDNVRYSIYASIFGSQKQKKDAERFAKLVRASRLINDTFIHFTSNGWISTVHMNSIIYLFIFDPLHSFSTTNLIKYYAELDEEDRRVFFADTKEINWKSYYDYFCYGLLK
jgi:glyceronephosphate O-acyltransferase